MKKAIIISASSDIGYALSLRWLSQEFKLYGTYRRRNTDIDNLNKLGMSLVPCDLANKNSILEACKGLRKLCDQWDALIVCPGLLEPIGPFSKINFDEWESSISVNFTNQLRITYELLPCRNTNAMLEPVVLYFAGGGTNSAPINYSAYTVSKIALIKMCELLDSEIKDTRFVILGPGWVKTKIHESTLQANKLAGENYHKTLERINKDNFTPMDKVLDCCDWLLKASRKEISGRNFSVVHDQWESPALSKALVEDSSMYKLRRHGNDWKASS